MRLIVRFVGVVILTLGLCGIVSASGDQPTQQAIVQPDKCCIPPQCPPCGLPPSAK